MSDFEKAVRFLCLFKAESCDKTEMLSRYTIIESMVHGDDKLIKHFVKKYEKMLDVLSN